jgi:uroporphyrinogen-III decarboxylase
MRNEQTTVTMSPRKRWLETVLYGRPDKIPLQPGDGRESTMKRWRQEGVSDKVKDFTQYAYRQAGGKEPWPKKGEGFYVNDRMIPQFEEKILEERDRTIIVQDWKGNICEISKEYTVEYLRNPIDFVTRRWISCPVETQEDWEQMKKRYNPEEPSRLPSDAQARAQRLLRRKHTVSFGFPGPFWQLREWVGFERMCMMFCECPDFVEKMIGFWQDYIATLLKKALTYIVPDYIRIDEDMAYKGRSMISPAMVRRFLLPTWKSWINIARSHGCQVFLMDSDGYVGELIPLWIEAGINVCQPMEVAAGCDIVEFSRKFGKAMAYVGGVDKRSIAAGGETIASEIKRLRPVIESGGYIPACDHGVPADVSWTNFVYYCKLLAEATGWL